MNMPTIPADLHQWTGGYDFSELYGLGPLFRNVAMTPGVKALADAAQCYWLVDAIASHLQASKVS